MAQILGDSGTYVSDAAERESRKIVLLVATLVGFLGAIEGFCLASWLRPVLMPEWLLAGLTLGVPPLLYLLWKWGIQELEQIERNRMALRSGAGGEDLVGRALARFPGQFYIINDLTTPFGNLDHVVIGPTGVYLLETKAWRGVVSSDGKGELLHDGQPAKKPHVRRFIARATSIREKIRILAPRLDPYFDSVFVFTAARVDARWGTTGKVNCIRDEQLHDYIVEKNFGKRLSPAEAQTLARAFLALATMDRDFAEGAGPVPERAMAA